MKTRYLLVSNSMGVYLGSCLGMGFWSELETAGQDAACTFLSPEEIRAEIATWDCARDLPDDLTFPAVELEDDTIYATEAQCAALGIKPWTAMQSKPLSGGET